MKKNILYILSLLILLVACDEDSFLTTKPDGVLTAEAFYRNADDVEAAMATVYAQLGGSGFWDVTEVNMIVEHFRSDFVEPGAGSLGYADWVAVSNFTNTMGNTRVSAFWDDTYRGIYHANEVIERTLAMGEEKISTDKKNTLIAEAKFLRAFLHFRLNMYFEEVIIRDAVPHSLDELSKATSTREDVWTFIENDLLEAIKYLPVKQDNNNIGRATKGAAIAYLGKVHLYQADFEAAKNEFKKLVVDQIGNYSLTSDFLSNFDQRNGNNSESVFELQFSPILSNGSWMGHYTGKFISPEDLGGWYCVKPTQKLLTEMKKEGKISTSGKYDTRLYQTVYFNDPDVSVFGKSFSDAISDGSVDLIFRKYIRSDVTQKNNDRRQTVMNIQQMRYADVLLMYAESLNETGDQAGAKTYIDMVRNRADMPVIASGLTKVQTHNIIMHERTMEFAFEGHRFFDLRRWGKDLMTQNLTSSGKTGAANFKFDNHAYFPIPEKERNTNNKIQ